MSGWLLKVAKSDHFIIHTPLPLLHETLYAGRVKLFAEASQVVIRALFQLVVFSKTASSGVHPSGVQK